ncbi:hypothetical protein JG663_17775 [Vibrio cholerae]|uniref:hypothetical protein n=1 Tax=Vibrio cholerae TaxID=666 RepID=UPI0018F0E3C1|nr:hypothetical protein [Vibrio cholerae]EKF9103732.1 hypothetical protein [Vibrio cholerae]MBJ6881576.1 hypothetical protein [Vibrio cholerae]MBJ6885104.1 hypothetical protein [Vibrio cholerae]MBJ6892740.1 hypothetical protein [Vibrio cholerae]
MVFNFSKYQQLQKELYPNIIEHDYIRHYFIERFTRNNIHLMNVGYIGKQVRIDYGKKELVTVKLKPTNGIVKRLGDEFGNQVLTHFSREYWLVALWLMMYEDSKNNQLAREILRAFIKTCICCTSKIIIMSANDEVSKNNVKSLLPEKLEFYSQVFSSSAVYKNMRSTYRDKLRAHSSEHSVRLLNNYLDYSLQSDDIPPDIFSSAGLSDYSTLIKMSSRYANEEEIKTIRRTISIFINNLSGKNKIKREIKSLVQKRRLSYAKC